MPEEKVEVLEGTMTEPKILSGTPQMVDQLEGLMREIEKMPPPTVGAAMNITKTDRIKVHYAQMPISDLSIAYLYQVLEPIALVVQQWRTTVTAHLVKEIGGTGPNDPIQSLKNHILDQYRANFVRKADRNALREAGYGWLISVDKVDLIECDILVPKSNSKPQTEAK
jgi:hypothetical protein